METYKIFDNGNLYGQTTDPVEALLCLAKLFSRGDEVSLLVENAHMLKGA